MTPQVNVLNFTDKNLMLRLVKHMFLAVKKSLKSFIALVPMLLMISMGRKSARLSCCYFSVKIQLKYFSTIYPFSEPEPPSFLRLRLRLQLRAKRFRRLRLQLRVRTKCVGSGGSGSSSCSGSASLVKRC